MNALRPIGDATLLLLLVAIAFLLACVELADPDVWWHLRGGQWIIEHGRAPGLDPFTFGSADRQWVDIHWLYEVILASAHAAGGVKALVLLAAILAGGAMTAALTARRRDWPAVAVALCWLPALVLLGFRLDPRPEVFSLFYLACFLSILSRVKDQPKLIWLLPPLQVLWVNMQGLFVFGPVLVGLFVSAKAAELAWQWLTGSLRWDEQKRRWWRHVGLAAVALMAACLINPYFTAGATFPLELFPKVADADNPYKQSIDELMSARDYLALKSATNSVASPHGYFLALYFLLLILPLSFLVPASWRAVRPLAENSDWDSAGVWFGCFFLLAVGMAFHAASPFASGIALWLTAAGEYLPLAIAVVGLFFAAFLRQRPLIAALVLAGGVAQTLWMAWLRSVLLAGDGLLGLPDYSSLLTVPLGVAVLLAGSLILHWQASLFRCLVAGAFAYLSLQAIQNWSRFALVAGMILAWNLGEWAAQVIAARQAERMHWAPARLLQALLLLVLGGWTAALLTDRYHQHTGEPRHLGFREQPLEFAHEAARFAAREGLPDRALIFPVAQANVYVFHNAPRAKPFIDGRFEMPDRATFETYLEVQSWLQQRNPRWEAVVERMGNPLILLQHRNNFAAEATLLSHADWRCIYFDAVASVFVHRSQQVSQQDFPTVDFLGRHFRQTRSASIPDTTGAAAAEMEALFNVVTALNPDSQSNRRLRTSLLWSALDRGELALADDPQRATTWLVLGGCYWYLNPDSQAKPSSATSWQPTRGAFWARTTRCLRRAIECQPRHRVAWRTLYNSFAVREIVDAQAAAGQGWLAVDPYILERQKSEIESLQPLNKNSGDGSPSVVDPPARLVELLRKNRLATATHEFERAAQRKVVDLDWAVADRLAVAYMHLGKPVEARRLWQEADNCPSEALRHLLLGEACRALEEDQSAIGHFRKAIELDGDAESTDAWTALAILHAERGDQQAAAVACRRALDASPNQGQREHLLGLQSLLAGGAK